MPSIDRPIESTVGLKTDFVAGVNNSSEKIEHPWRSWSQVERKAAALWKNAVMFILEKVPTKKVG